MQKLLLERSLGRLGSLRGPEEEEDDKGGQTTDWEIDIEAPKVVGSGQVGSYQKFMSGKS